MHTVALFACLIRCWLQLHTMCADTIAELLHGNAEKFWPNPILPNKYANIEMCSTLQVLPAATIHTVLCCAVLSRSLRILNVAEGEAVAQAPAHTATGTGDAASSPTLRSKSLLGCLHKQATTAGSKVRITCA